MLWDRLGGQILGVELANRESRSSWREFLLRLKERGLHGVEFVVSDGHQRPQELPLDHPDATDDFVEGCICGAAERFGPNGLGNELKRSRPVRPLR